MVRDDILKKVGPEIADRFKVINHNIWENLEYLGKTSNGTPLYLNRDFLSADLKINVGSILPHGDAGFGGGAKMTVPGVAGIETLYGNHRSDNGYARGINLLPESGNVLRSDIEDAARMGKLSAIVNVLYNPQLDIVGCVVGDFIKAHRAGVEIARRVYSTQVPHNWDICVLSAYPKDSEFIQSPNAWNIWHSASTPIVHEKGTVLLCVASSEGQGVHFLAGPNMKLARSKKSRLYPWLHDRTLLHFSPGVSPKDLEHLGDDGTSLCRSWDETLSQLSHLHGKRARVAVFPCSAMQLAGETMSQ